MKALIIGSGVIGVSSAYFLARHGWKVTVLDRQDGPGEETSFSNGSLLTPSMAEPCGLRPMSVDGVPIIGPTPIGNLWINTGHGPLGWTMAAGSGRLLSDPLTGGSPAVDPDAYAPSRFSGARR